MSRPCFKQTQKAQGTQHGLAALPPPCLHSQSGVPQPPPPASACTVTDGSDDLTS